MSKVRKIKCRSNAIDTHELLKREILRSADDNNYQFGGTINPQTNTNIATTTTAQTTNTTNTTVNNSQPQQSTVGFTDTEFYFDSINKDGTSDIDNGEIKFQINTLNNGNPIQNIVQLKVGSFYFPSIQNDTTSPQFYFFRRVYAQITNLPSTQSVLAGNNKSYHFEFDVENVNSIAVKLVPIKDTFFLQRPLNSLDSITIRFMVPLNFSRIPIPQDSVVISTVNGSNPAQFTISGTYTTAILGDVGTPVAPGIAVSITGLTTPDATVNSTLGNSAGIYVTRIVDDTTIEISGVDLSDPTDFPPLGPSYNATLYIFKNRIALPMRFTSVNPQITNYVSTINS